jgi:tRNA(Glu) U13 pseudouridine synthase TruD
MFEVDIKVNGCMVSHIYGHNMTGGDNPNYYYELHRFGSNGDVTVGKLKHKSKEGIEKLVYLVLKDALKERKK